jgi:hypothetical protein
MILDTRFLKSTAALRLSQRLDLLKELSPESEAVGKLYAADKVMPEGNVLAFGPWDVYQSDGTWYVRDILNRATATMSGAIHFEDGNESRQRAIVIEEATTNLVTNPSAETAATNYTTAGSTSVARSGDYAKYGNYSIKCVTSTGLYGGIKYNQTGGLSGSTQYTVSVWVFCEAGIPLSLQFRNDADSATIESANFTSTGSWQRVEVTATSDAGQTNLNVHIRKSNDATNVDLYVDGLQCEEKDYATSYADGSLGEGYAWTGTPHDSTSSRTATEFTLNDHTSLISGKDTLSFRMVLQAPLDADDANFPVYVMDARGADNNDRILIQYLAANDTFALYINGSYREGSAVQTFSAGDWVELVVTLDFTNDEYKVYTAGTLDDTDTTSLSAPTGITNWTLGASYVESGHGNWTFSEFDVWDRVLTASEISQIYENGTVAGRARWVEALCTQAFPLQIGGTPTDKGIVSNLAISGDIRWQSRDGDAYFFQPADDTWTHTINADSDSDVYPAILIEPTETKTGDYAYKRFVPIKWRARQANIYPVLLGTLDTATLIAAGKMQADGDDLRVFVDGIEVDRWIQDINTASTEIWANMNFQNSVSATLSEAIGSGDAGETITCSTSIKGFPNSGIVQIDSEIFVYTSKNNTNKTLLGCTRAAKGTSAADHTVGDTVFWVQHDVWILYGNSSVSAPSVDDDYQPAFALTSTNTSWVYANFGDDNLKRAGRWQSQVILANPSNPTFYTANRGTDASPWSEIGIYAKSIQNYGRWYLFNPCYITNANFTNGEKYVNSAGYFDAKIESSRDGATWFEEDTISEPGSTTTWTSWSDNEALRSLSTYVALRMGESPNPVTGMYVEVSDVTITLNSSYTPVASIGGEQSNYNLDVTLENETTGQSIELLFTMAEDQVLEVDTANKVITYQKDGSKQMQAITLVGGARKEWFKLQPGDNVINWSDTGTAGVNVALIFNRRYLE